MGGEIITAEELAKGMREISIAEFFEKNKHFLGYENPTRSLLTVVKEAIDNSLDATCDAKILPDIVISIKEIDQNRGVKGEKGTNNEEKQDRFRILSRTTALAYWNRKFHLHSVSFCTEVNFTGFASPEGSWGWG